MTPEEIQRTIEGMLAVQRELQNSQFKLQEESQRQREDFNLLREESQRQREDFNLLREESQRQREDFNLLREESQRQREDINVLVQSIGQLLEVSNRHERRIEQLIGYSITSDSDRLDVQQQLLDLAKRVEKLENQAN
jgi:chromosome segregation ATPase